MIKISWPWSEVLNNEWLHPDTTFHVFCENWSNGCKCANKANCPHFQNKVVVRTKYTGNWIGSSIARILARMFPGLEKKRYDAMKWGWNRTLEFEFAPPENE